MAQTKKTSNHTTIDLKETGDKADAVSVKRGASQTTGSLIVSKNTSTGNSEVLDNEATFVVRDDSDAASVPREGSGRTSDSVKQVVDWTANGSKTTVEKAAGDSKRKGDLVTAGTTGSGGGREGSTGGGTVDAPIERGGREANGTRRKEDGAAAGGSNETGSSETTDNYTGASSSSETPDARIGVHIKKYHATKIPGGGTGRGSKKKGGAKAAETTRTKQAVGTSGGPKTKGGEVAGSSGQNKDNSSKAGSSKDNQTDQLKLHAFIQPAAWNIDVNVDQPIVELRSQYWEWASNCAEVKLK